MLSGNAQLQGVHAGGTDDYGVPVEGGAKWTGAEPCRVVDRTRTAPGPGGGLDRVHVTQVWLPARLVADGGGYLALAAGDYLDVQQDGVVTRYRVTDWSDWGQRTLGSPSSVRADVERLPA
jgi:hypothetical protein